MTLTANAKTSRAAAIWTTRLAMQTCRATRVPATVLQAALSRAVLWSKTDIPIGQHPTSEVPPAVPMTAILEMDLPNGIWIHQLRHVLVTVLPSPARMFGVLQHHITHSALARMQATSGHRSSRKLQHGATTTIATTDSAKAIGIKLFQHLSSSILLRCAAASSWEVPTSFQVDSVATVATTTDGSKMEIEAFYFMNTKLTWKIQNYQTRRM